PPRLEQTLARFCAENRRTKSEVIIDLLERGLVSEPEKTPYELAVETGFVGMLELDENAAAESRSRVREAIARKHGTEAA
ncbi:MAG: hypothetical protein LBR05_07610, partial [Azoarcus sp.]|nr:hypothetical protein [Azoarcus sp.]